MLALNPHLMASMDDLHLIAALEAEGPLTPAERELCGRLEALAEQESAEEIESRLAKEYEVAMEQSDFRAGLIERILELCEAPGTKAALVANIKAALENSYVEL